jgi:hypothetical protein
MRLPSLGLKAAVIFLIIAWLSYCPTNMLDQQPTQVAAVKTDVAGGPMLPAQNHRKISWLFTEWIQPSAYTDEINLGDEKDILRNKWENLLGVDIFYPYFKAQEAQDWVSNKTAVQFLDIKGKAEIKKNTIRYSFKKNF